MASKSYDITSTSSHAGTSRIGVLSPAELHRLIGDEQNKVIIIGEKPKDEGAPEIQYVHKGISARSFTRTFTLAEHMEVKGATVNNGVLAIALEQIVPEEQKPKKIQITFTK